MTTLALVIKHSLHFKKNQDAVEMTDINEANLKIWRNTIGSITLQKLVYVFCVRQCFPLIENII